MRLKVGVIGASGRMGQEIGKVLLNHPRLVPEVGIALEGEVSGFQRSCLMEELDESFGLAGLIDFSVPETVESTTLIAQELGLPVVMGTTGLSAEHHKLIQEAAEEIPFFWSPNMSLGVALLLRSLKALRPDESYDVHIEEIHHRHKKDQPSGTAKLIHSQIEAAWNRSIQTPQSIRGGGDFGTHTVRLMGSSETLTFTHQALNRSVFAEGAVSVLEWLLRQKPGLYGFDDFFGGKDER